MIKSALRCLWKVLYKGILCIVGVCILSLSLIVIITTVKPEYFTKDVIKTTAIHEAGHAYYCNLIFPDYVDNVEIFYEDIIKSYKVSSLFKSELLTMGQTNYSKDYIFDNDEKLSDLNRIIIIQSGMESVYRILNKKQESKSDIDEIDEIYKKYSPEEKEEIKKLVKKFFDESPKEYKETIIALAKEIENADIQVVNGKKEKVIPWVNLKDIVDKYKKEK